jgi:hypothetical protein
MKNITEKFLKNYILILNLLFYKNYILILNLLFY